jgi:ketopantoate reductase
MLTLFLQTTLTGVDTQSWLSSPEVIRVGQRCGVPLKDELISVLMDRINSILGIYSSMYVDAQEGRRLEVDVILGYPVKRAKELGMDVPTLAALYALLKAVDGRLGK